MIIIQAYLNYLSISCKYVIFKNIYSFNVWNNLFNDHAVFRKESGEPKAKAAILNFSSENGYLSIYVCELGWTATPIAQRDRVDRGLYRERWTWAVIRGTLHVSGMRNV